MAQALGEKMRKSILLPIILIILISIANAEIYVSGTSLLDKNAKTLTEINYISYPLDETFIGKPVKFNINLACESITDFNTANPSFTVQNVSIRTIYAHFISSSTLNFSPFELTLFSSQFTYETILADYGCDSSSSCTTANTPVVERDIPYFFTRGEILTIQLVTYFNSSVVEDSPCGITIDFNSQNCRGCKELNFEQVTKKLDTRVENFEKRTSIYSSANNMINFNYSIWLYTSYIIKIGVLLGVIFGFIWLIMWLYHFLKYDLNKK